MTIVSTTSGELAGSEAAGVHSFKGIPYAAPISGENRWLPPKAPESWSGVRPATRFGKICPQAVREPASAASDTDCALRHDVDAARRDVW